VLRTLRLLLLCIIVAAISLIAGAYAGIIKKVDELQGPVRTSTQPTYIYSGPLGDSEEGARRVLASIFQGKNRETASLEEMPPYLLNAVVAKEDHRFREHGGVDVWGILRALYVDIRAGGAVEGASTITQQYVKNAYLSSEQSISRKVKEAALSIEVERRYSKDKILGMYLNTLYFGNNAYGIEAAAQTYYNKSVEDLTLPESATMVGLVWSPSSLGSNKEAAKEQRNLVLEQMFEAGYINRQDYLDALEKPMPQEWPMIPMSETGLSGPNLTRGFADYVQQQLVERYGARTVMQGGFSVYTTLNLETQMQARKTLYGSGGGYLNDSGDPDAALVSINPKTEEIEAMVGNRDPEAQFNLATQSRRQPGSSFKPFALIAALEQGIDPETKFVSEDKTYKIKKPSGTIEKWEVENYDGIERGEISLKKALWQSDNTVFTDLVMNASGKGLKNGPEKVANVAKRLGISTDFGGYTHPSIVLGTQEVSPMEMATAYATIANHGRRVEPTAISKVVKSEDTEDDKVLYKHEDKKGEQVIDRKIADKTIKLMEGDIDNGISDDASLEGRDAAGKSGTTENFFDAWFIGFTPQLTTAVWMGYAKGGKTLESLNYDRETLTSMPENIWRSYMQKAMAGEPKKEFEGEPEPPEKKEKPQKGTTSKSNVSSAPQ
jgi:penicillin-binding protein 1A